MPNTAGEIGLESESSETRQWRVLLGGKIWDGVGRTLGNPAFCLNVHHGVA